MFLLSLYIISLIFYSIITRNIIPTKNMQDMVHNNIYLPDYYISDIMITIKTIYTIFNINYENFKEFILIMTISQFLRTILSSVTILPQLKKYNDKIRFLGIFGTGTDYIFSGHAAYSALSLIYLIKYNLFNTYTIILYSIISNSIIIFTRNHYTVDVLLSWIIIPSLWFNLNFCRRDIDCKTYLDWL